MNAAFAFAWWVIGGVCWTSAAFGALVYMEARREREA